MVGRLRVLVLSGGDSPEREISLASGRCVAVALREEGCQVDVVDPSETNVVGLQAQNWDIAFPLVHGTGGEDGVLQRALRQAGIPYVGSSPEASQLTFDKALTRERLLAHDIQVPPGAVVRVDQPHGNIRQIAGKFGYPVVTKPTCQGSSVGVTIVTDEAGLQAAVQTAFEFGSQCLIERYIAGREVTVPVIDGDVFPPVEIVVAEQWYDYRAKYADDRTQYRVAPDDLPDNLNTVTGAACGHCGVSGIARVDYRIDSSAVAWLLEINTVPGMTSHSLVPKSAAAKGLSPGQLCLQSIQHRLATRQ